MRQVAFLFLFCLSARELRAQDSSRADWRQWFATKDSVARCRKYPMLMRFYGVEGEFTTHRTPSGGTCQAGPGPGEPTVWVVDSRAYCPDSNPATWRSEPPGFPIIDENRIAEINVTRDSSVLRSYHCPIRPRGAVLFKTIRRP